MTIMMDCRMNHWIGSEYEFIVCSIISAMYVHNVRGE